MTNTCCRLSFEIWFSLVAVVLNSELALLTELQRTSRLLEVKVGAMPAFSLPLCGLNIRT